MSDEITEKDKGSNPGYETIEYLNKLYVSKESFDFFVKETNERFISLENSWFKKVFR